MFRMVHANINVYDLERSLEFYKKALGLDVVRTKETDDFKIVFLQSEGAKCVLELTWLAEMDRPYNLGDNESHICFETDDYDKAHELHKSLDCICYENLDMGLYFIEDPDGYWIEIIKSKK